MEGITLNGLDQRRLEHFLTVVRLGSINRAAREINISQAGMTKSIQTLEDSLGVMLFSRGPKGVNLTHCGRTLHSHAVMIQNMYGSALRAVEAARSGKAAILKIGISLDWFLHEAMSGVVSRLLSDPRMPHFELISGMNSWHLVDQLSRGDLDMAVCTPNAFDQLEDFVFLQGLMDRQGVFVAKDNPLAEVRTPTLDQLDAAGWVLAEKGTFYRRMLTGIYQSQKRLLPTPRVTSHSSLSILKIVAQTGHVGVGTQLLADIQLPGALTMLQYPAQVERPLGIVHRRNEPLSDVCKLMIERILEALDAFQSGSWRRASGDAIRCADGE